MASRKILAVDDSVSIRKSISFILGQEDFEVVEAENGADGLAKATASNTGMKRSSLWKTYLITWY